MRKYFFLQIINDRVNQRRFVMFCYQREEFRLLIWVLKNVFYQNITVRHPPFVLTKSTKYHKYRVPKDPLLLALPLVSCNISRGSEMRVGHLPLF